MTDCPVSSYMIVSDFADALVQLLPMIFAAGVAGGLVALVLYDMALSVLDRLARPKAEARA